MKFRSLILGLPLFYALAPALTLAEHAPTQTFHVLRPLIHSEQDQAELCLEFDSEVDASASIKHFASSLHLESKDKIIPLSAKNISIGGNQLCISSLEHRKTYNLTVSDLQNAKGEKLSKPYNFSFTIPERQATLSFIFKESRDGMSVGSDNPLLHSLNTKKVALEMYRITDPSQMAEAWNKRQQTTLVPSESLYFARHNGALMWKKTITVDPAADKNIDTPIDLNAQNPSYFPPGLYLIAASDADNLSAKKRNDSGKENALTPSAAAWLLRSNLKLDGLKDGDRFRILAETADSTTAAENVRILVMDHDQYSLLETQTDSTGQATLQFQKGKGNAETVIGITKAGDVAFLDLSGDAVENPVLPSMVTDLEIDHAVAAPRETIGVILTASDLHKNPLSVTGSVLQLLRPDRSLYTSQKINLDPKGTSKISLPAPIQNGLWHLVWKAEDGKTLAEKKLRISSNPEAPQLNVTADRAFIGSDNAVDLTFHSLTNDKAPSPYIAGHVTLTWTTAEHPFSAWKDYVFDDGKTIDPTTKTIGYFLTDANGFAHLHLSLPDNKNAPALREARLHIISDPSSGTLDPEALVLPVKPADIVIGIKPQAFKGRFPENTVAHFDVIALNGDGEEQSMDDLTYQIFEEGRSFEWYQSEGHWNYKPQQQRRRLGGGHLTFNNNQASINWPVTSGAYHVEIMNSDGVLVARTNFNAGWGVSETAKESFDSLSLESSPPHLQMGQENSITFTLAHPAMITASIADDHIRNIIHANYPAGLTKLNFTSAADWGSRVLVHIEARYTASVSEKPKAIGDITLTADVGAAPVAPPTVIKTPNVETSEVPLSLKSTSIKDDNLTLAPKMSWSVTANKTAKPSGSRTIFLAPENLYDLPIILSQALHQHPFTTRDLARSLAVLHLWREPILAANLLTETEWKSLQSDLVTRLIARQKTDGGFGPEPNDETSDNASTSAAVEALARIDDPLFHPVIDQATGWLNHQLENTWFEESARPERSAIYAALATAGKLDQASLHYFSDTSADKPLPPLAAARLAYAFASINDKYASNFWIEKVFRVTVPTNAAPMLLANTYFSLDTAPSILQQTSQAALANPNDSSATSDFLIALWRYVDRSGTWKVTVGKDEKTIHGIMVLPITEASSLTLRNPSQDQILHLIITTAEKAATDIQAHQRRIYTLDGAVAPVHLQSGKTYAVMLNGSEPKQGQDAFIVHEDPPTSLRPITCAIETPSADSFLGWLSYKNLTSIKACEKSASGIDVLLTHNDKDSTWRAAYLAKTTGSP